MIRLQRKALPKDISELLSLQSSSGQWRLCDSLYRCLGHSSSTIPLAPSGEKDWRWSTALAVIHLRRRPELIDETFDAYNRALPWVDEPILAKAHKCLPPGGLYYQVDGKASREGRWQEFAAEALEECGYAYFLPADAVPTVRRREEGNNKDDLINTEHSREDSCSSLFASETECRSNALTLYEQPDELRRQRGTRPANKSGRQRARRPVTSARLRPAVVAKKQALEQSHGLRSELRHAVIAARNTFKEGDRVESRWRRPTRMDRARLDPHAWYPGRVLSVSKDGCVDMTFEDGDRERLSGIPDTHVRLAPRSLSVPPVTNCPESILQTASITYSASKSGLSCESLRELAHVAITTKILRRAWEDPLTMNQELSRLRGLWEERIRSRPSWRGSFPAVNFQATKKVLTGGGATPTARGGPEIPDGLRQQHSHALYDTKKRRTRRTSRVLRAGSDYHDLVEASTKRLGRERRANLDPQSFVNALESSEAPSVPPSLVKAQFDMVAAVMVYDSCVSTVRDCLERGVSSFNAARTYSELQKAFEEVTRNLGPAQRARPGYRDWRGNAIVGLQSATLDVVEAMDAWSMERAAILGQTAIEEEKGCSVGGEQRAKAPPFLWEGSPVVSTIIAHSAMLFKRAPQLKAWYGPGFPVKRNPFFLAYSIDDRPVTPRNTFARTDVHGKITTTVSATLLTEKKKEEAALKAVLDKQAAAPMWWPATGGTISEEHCSRIRQAEKVLLREERNVTAGPVVHTDSWIRSRSYEGNGALTWWQG